MILDMLGACKEQREHLAAQEFPLDLKDLVGDVWKLVLLQTPKSEILSSEGWKKRRRRSETVRWHPQWRIQNVTR